jgi:hypothetical protein
MSDQSSPEGRAQKERSDGASDHRPVASTEGGEDDVLNEHGQEPIPVCGVDPQREVLVEEVVEVQERSAVLEDPQIEREDDRPGRREDDEERAGDEE